jgi:HAD superfamily hydrolase (TIGR01509 family)
MSEARTHEAYLVDLDGTLYRQRWVQVGMGLELLTSGLHRAGWLRKFRHTHERMRQEMAEEGAEFEPSPYAEQLRRTYESLGAPPDDLERVVRRWMIERPGKWLKLAKNHDLVAEIVAFRAQGGKTALVSDYPARSKLAALGCDQHFDLVVANGEFPGLKRLKPAPDGFLAAAGALGVRPDRCLVIGDRTDADGLAAARAGMEFRLVGKRRR